MTTTLPSEPAARAGVTSSETSALEHLLVTGAEPVRRTTLARVVTDIAARTAGAVEFIRTGDPGRDLSAAAALCAQRAQVLGAMALVGAGRPEEVRVFGTRLPRVVAVVEVGDGLQAREHQALEQVIREGPAVGVSVVVVARHSCQVWVGVRANCRHLGVSSASPAA